MHEPDWEWDQLPDIYTRGPVFSDTVGRPTPRPEMSDRVRKGSRDINMDFRGPNIARIPQVTATSPGRKGMLPIGHEPSWSQKFDDNVRAQIAQEALEDAREREWRQRQGMLGKAAMDRLIDLLKGGAPRVAPAFFRDEAGDLPLETDDLARLWRYGQNDERPDRAIAAENFQITVIGFDRREKFF
jgi:hypothetical protein